MVDGRDTVHYPVRKATVQAHCQHESANGYSRSGTRPEQREGLKVQDVNEQIAA